MQRFGLDREVIAVDDNGEPVAFGKPVTTQEEPVYGEVLKANVDGRYVYELVVGDELEFTSRKFNPRDYVDKMGALAQVERYARLHGITIRD